MPAKFVGTGENSWDFMGIGPVGENSVGSGVKRGIKSAPGIFAPLPFRWFRV